MLVQIKSAPAGMGLSTLIQVAVCHTAKAITLVDGEQFLVEIHHGNEEDIQKLKKIAGITVEKITK